MDAFLFTIALFSLWAVVGFAVISVCHPRTKIMQGVLLSPAVGIATTILPVFFINRLGVPVKDFGAILLLVLWGLAIAVLVVTRPIFPARRLLPYIGVLIIALVLTARPMFSYGFDWLSFSNDDMANYCLAAQRFLNHGFFEQPNLNDFLAGKDYSLAYWFMHGAGGVRAGSELMLAVVWAFSGLNAHQIFMPVIMALHLSLIVGTGALIEGSTKVRCTSLIAIGLMAISPLTALSALYQLIGQVGGLALLVAAVTLMYRPVQRATILKLACSSVPAALIFASLFVWYPEVLPFFGLGWILYAVLLIKFGRENLHQLLMPAIVIGLIVSVVLNKFVITAIVFLLGQASGGMQSADMSSVLFPYFLVPSGIPAFWGLITITGNTLEPFVSLSIVGGLILFYWLLRFALPRQIRRANASVSLLLVMLAMGLILFFRNNDFGLFKLAMFAQPFLLAVVAVELVGVNWAAPPRFIKITFPVFLISLLFSQYGYVGKSTGEEFGGLNEIPYASALKVNKQFDELLNTIAINQNSPQLLILDTSNIVLAKFQALYSNGRATVFPSRPFFRGIFNGWVGGEAANKTDNFIDQFKTVTLEGNQFDVLNPSVLEGRSPIFIYSAVQSDIFNSYYLKQDEKRYFVVDETAINRLRFTHSMKGNHYYLGDRKLTSFYQLENDPMFPGRKFSSLGRNLFFQVINPSKQPRMVMELTTTVVKQFGSELPRPFVEKTQINFVGRGSGRIFSEPITPSKVNGSDYVSIDMGRDGKLFPSLTMGLMQLFGREIPVDQRRITAFGRDISLISEDQYQALQPPSALKSFPSDLGGKNLEYSGIYEDGWISEKSFFVLSPNSNSKFITVTGIIPMIENSGFSTILKLSVNGKEIGSQHIGLGDFKLKLPITSLVPKQRIDLEFTNYQKLPGADGRMASAHINFIGFE